LHWKTKGNIKIQRFIKYIATLEQYNSKKT